MVGCLYYELLPLSIEQRFQGNAEQIAFAHGSTTKEGPVAQAHDEWDQYVTVHPEPVEGLNQRYPNIKGKSKAGVLQ